MKQLILFMNFSKQLVSKPFITYKEKMNSINSFSSPINPPECNIDTKTWPYLKPLPESQNFQGPSFWVCFRGCFRRRLPTVPAKALELQVWWKLSASVGVSTTDVLMPSMEVPYLFFP